MSTASDEQNVNGLCSLREALINANANNQSGSLKSCGLRFDAITLSMMAADGQYKRRRQNSVWRVHAASGCGWRVAELGMTFEHR